MDLGREFGEDDHVKKGALMKLRSFLIAIAVFSQAVFAAKDQIKVEAQLLVNGKVMSSPKIVALAGEPASVSTNHMRMNVTAKPADVKMEDFVLDMYFKYVYGDRTIESSPQVYLKAGQEAIMTLEESSAGEKIQLRVNARPVIR